MPVMINQVRMTGQKDRDMFQFNVDKEETYYWVVKDCYQMFRKDYDNENMTLYVNLRPYNNDVEFDHVPTSKEEKEADESLDQPFVGGDVIDWEKESKERGSSTPTE
jgi:hypothetical protein